MKNDKNGKKEVPMVNGIIVIDKPKGYTSHDVVAKVKRILQVSYRYIRSKCNRSITTVIR